MRWSKLSVMKIAFNAALGAIAGALIIIGFGDKISIGILGLYIAYICTKNN